MTGWRIGFAVGDEKIIQAMTQLASQSTSNPVDELLLRWLQLV
jgi:aspartate/methionine/tyrosine aminotransferase